MIAQTLNDCAAKIEIDRNELFRSDQLAQLIERTNSNEISIVEENDSEDSVEELRVYSDSDLNNR